MSQTMKRFEKRLDETGTMPTGKPSDYLDDDTERRKKQRSVDDTWSVAESWSEPGSKANEGRGPRASGIVDNGS